MDTEPNLYQKSFGTEIDIGTWNDWVQWDGAAFGVDSSTLERNNTGDCTLSAYNTAAVEMRTFPTYSTGVTFPLDDAPFELYNSPDSSQVSSHYEAPRNPDQQMHGQQSNITATEQQTYQDIAEPEQTLSRVKISSQSSSPRTPTLSQSRSPSPEPAPRSRKLRTNKKRKQSIDDEEVPNIICQSRKRSHNAIERRYRTNLNNRITFLDQGIPKLWRNMTTDSKSSDEGEQSDNEAVDRKNGQQKYGKAAVLTRALEYIQHLESTTQKLGDELLVLKERIIASESGQPPIVMTHG